MCPYFSFNLLTTQLSVPVIVYLYNKHYDAEDEIDATTTWAIAGTLLTLWLITFSFLIFYIIVPEYRKTFFSFQTGWEKSQAFFLDNEDDEARRVVLFDSNIHHWRSLEDEVREWTFANWQRWEEEKPAWFTPFRIASIPDDFIPADAIQALGGVERARRGSASLNAAEAEDLGRRLEAGGGES